MMHKQPKGLPNITQATCWWNSLLQSLIAIKAINDYDSIEMPLDSNNQQCVHEALYQIINSNGLSNEFSIKVKDSLKCLSCLKKRTIGITNTLELQVPPEQTIIPDLIQSEILDDVECPFEQKKTTQKKTTRYTDFSKYLIFTASAFSYTSKWKTYPTLFISIDKKSKGVVTTFNYELLAFILHKDSRTSTGRRKKYSKNTEKYGHYFAIVKYDDQWFLCNDEEIIILSERKVDRFLSSKDIYMSFYKQY